MAYAWRQLAQRAGVHGGDPAGNPFRELGVEVDYASPERAQASAGVVVVPAGADAWQALPSRPAGSIGWVRAATTVPAGAEAGAVEPVPVPFWGEGYEDGHKPFAERNAGGQVVFYADIIATTFLMLTRWEESASPERDMHGRFPATASLAYRQGFLDRPVVDEYALILRAWLLKLSPGWSPARGRFQVRLSHDVDSVRAFPSLSTAMHKLAGDLLKRRSPQQAWRTGSEAIRQTLAPARSPRFAGIRWLADASRAHGLDSAFYFMATDPGPLESDYAVEMPAIRRCIEALRADGLEIGLHASYRALNDPQRLAAEKSRLDAILGEGGYGGRQHYLRFQAPNTWRDWERVGLAHDATLSYADRPGFRCGTCHAFRPFDTLEDRELGVWERPLVAMDGALRAICRDSPQEGEAQILALARRCAAVEGTFTLLWHNSSLQGDWLPWAEMYRRVLGALSGMAAG